MKTPPDSIVDETSLANYRRAAWAGRGYEFTIEPTEDYPAFERRIHQHQVPYETRSEASGVEHFTPYTRMHELQETLKNNWLMLVAQRPYTERVNVIVPESSPTDDTDILARRTVSFIVGALGEWVAECVLVTRREEIADIEGECKEFCDSHGLTEIVKDCLRQATQIFAHIVDISVDFDVFEEDAVDDTGHVVVRVKTQADQASTREQYDSWFDWFIENVGDRHRSLITLTVGRV